MLTWSWYDDFHALAAYGAVGMELVVRAVELEATVGYKVLLRVLLDIVVAKF